MKQALTHTGGLGTVSALGIGSPNAAGLYRGLSYFVE